MLCLSREGFAEAAGTNAKHMAETIKRKKDNPVSINLFFNGIDYPASRRTYYFRAINVEKDFLEVIDILQDPLIYCKQHGEQSAGPVTCRFQHVFLCSFFRDFCGKDEGALS